MTAKSDSASDDKMGLVRDAKSTSERWKSELPPDYICSIERRCEKLLNRMGLELVCRS